MRHLTILALGLFVAFSVASPVWADTAGRNGVRALDRIQYRDSVSSSPRAFAEENGRGTRVNEASQARVGEPGRGNGLTQGNGSSAGNRNGNGTGSQMGSRGNRGSNGPGAGTCETPGARSNMGNRGRGRSKM